MFVYKSLATPNSWLIKRFSIQALCKQFQKVRMDAVNDMSRAMTD